MEGENEKYSEEGPTRIPQSPKSPSNDNRGKNQLQRLGSNLKNIKINVPRPRRRKKNTDGKANPPQPKPLPQIPKANPPQPEPLPQIPKANPPQPKPLPQIPKANPPQPKPLPQIPKANPPQPNDEDLKVTIVPSEEKDSETEKKDKKEKEQSNEEDRYKNMEDFSQTSKRTLFLSQNKSESDRKKEKEKLNQIFLEETFGEDQINYSILCTVNKLNKSNFDNFTESYQNDSIPKFVMRFFNIKTIKDVVISPHKSHTRKLTEQQLKNIRAVIEFLKLKENKFQVLLFNFKHPLFAESSAISFYKTFLDSFFVKLTEKEMLDKCIIFIDPKQKQEYYDKYKTFFDIYTYARLAFFISHKGFLYPYFDDLVNNYDIANLCDELIPLNNKFTVKNDRSERLGIILDYCLCRVKIPMIISAYFLSICQKTLNLSSIIFYQLQFIFDYLDKNPAKTIIFNLLKSYFHVKVKPFDELTASIAAKRVSLILQERRYKQLLKEKNKNDEKEEEEENSEKIEKPKSYFERENISKDDHYLRLLSSKNYINDDAICDEKDKNFAFHSGILVNEEKFEERKKDWDEAIGIIQKSFKGRVKGPIIKGNPTSEDTTVKKKVDKLFYYNEDENKWDLNMISFYNFVKEKKYNVHMKTHLVYFSNSNENDLINISVSLKFSGYIIDFDDDDDKIFVYALGDYSNPFTIKPIFLFLHVPEKKRNLINLRTIITQIDCFLSFICDIKVVLFNDSYYTEQIKFEQSIRNITHSYKIKSDDENDEYLIELIEGMIQEKKPIFIGLFDCKISEKKFEENFKYSPFFKSIIDEIGHERSYMNCISTTNNSTYQVFKNALHEAINEGGNSNISLIEEKFLSIELSRISRIYIYLKNEKDWETQLEKIINNKYKIIKENQKNQKDVNKILLQLNLEVDSLSPFFDTDFKNKCQRILNDIRKKNSEKNGTLKIGLKKSSEENLRYLKQVINNNYDWTKEKRNDLIESHVQFLKEDFFQIFKKTYLNDDINKYYKECISILNSQIQSDKVELIEYFNIIIKSTKKEVRNKSTLNRGTNYTIREVEHKKEIKVTVEVDGELKNEIAQDF